MRNFALVGIIPNQTYSFSSPKIEELTAGSDETKKTKNKKKNSAAGRKTLVRILVGLCFCFSVWSSCQFFYLFQRRKAASFLALLVKQLHQECNCQRVVLLSFVFCLPCHHKTDFPLIIWLRCHHVWLSFGCGTAVVGSNPAQGLPHFQNSLIIVIVAKLTGIL